MKTLKTVPAPIGGWNTTSSIAQMPITDAAVLDNWIPSTGSVVNRKGYSLYATFPGDTVDSMFELKAATVNKAIAASNGGFYDWTAGGDAVLIKDGFTSDTWYGTIYNGVLGLVNGVDAPQIYDGTTMSDMTVSGITNVEDLVGITTFKNRTYFIEKNSQNFWYSDLSTMGGVLQSFPLGNVGVFGGNLIAIQTLTKDGGNGQQDILCFFMSTGEIIIYEGSDPGTNFSLIGIFKAGRPINARSIIKFGADIFFVSNEGYTTVSSLLPLSFGKTNTGLNEKIRGAASSAVAQFSTLFGWEVTLVPAESLLIVNVPQTTNTFVQHVLNVNTMAWCRFTDINARCWCVFGNNAYFGDIDGNIYKYGPLYTDAGDPITSVWQSPYYSFTNGAILLTAFRPRSRFDGRVEISISNSVDFKPFSTPYTVTYGRIGAFWGDPWGTFWADSNSVVSFLGLNNIAYSFSQELEFSTGSQVEFYAIDYLYKRSDRI